MIPQSERQVSQLVELIKGHRNAVDAEAKRLRTPEILTTFDKWSHCSWCLSVAGDCLVRLRLLLEQSFNFVETIGVVAVARYVFEMSLWLRLFSLDSRYGLVYYAELLRTQRRYWKDYRVQLDREITLLREFEDKEHNAQTRAMSNTSISTDSRKLNDDLLSIRNHIDNEAARRFSIYAEQAKTNGYGFQAYLLEKKVVPIIDQSLANVDSEQTAFYARIPQSIKVMIPANWHWRQLAQKVGLTDEYDFIYSFSSKLLHATPLSITTDQKNLELPEMAVFLKYINIKIVEVIELTREYQPIAT